MAFYSSYAFPTFAVSLVLLSCWKMRPLSLRWPISRWYCRWNKRRIQVRFIKGGLTSFDYDWHADTLGCLHSFRNLPKQSWLLAMVLLPGCRPGFSQKRCLVCECFFSLGTSQLLLINDPLRLRVMVSFFCIWCQMEKMVYRFTPWGKKQTKKPKPHATMYHFQRVLNQKSERIMFSSQLCSSQVSRATFVMLP